MSEKDTFRTYELLDCYVPNGFHRGRNIIG